MEFSNSKQSYSPIKVIVLAAAVCTSTAAICVTSLQKHAGGLSFQLYSDHSDISLTLNQRNLNTPPRNTPRASRSQHIHKTPTATAAMVVDRIHTIQQPIQGIEIHYSIYKKRPKLSSRLPDHPSKLCPARLTPLTCQPPLHTL